MNQAYRKATVYVQGIPAGRIEETEEGYVFAYSREYLEESGGPAVSLTLPLCAEPYRSHVLFPFFDGLIPEGWLLMLTQEVWKLNHRDRFGVLITACRDCIGDVSIKREE